MAFRLLLSLKALLSSMLASIEGHNPVGGQGNDKCCPFLIVDVGGNNKDLNGEYILKTKEEMKPDVACLNGCIYTKNDGDDEYCFKKDEESSAYVECVVKIFYNHTRYLDIKRYYFVCVNF